MIGALAVGLAAGGVGAGAAAGDPDVDAGLDPYRLYADLMVSGGSSAASGKTRLPCRAIHLAIDDFNEARPWEDPAIDLGMAAWPVSHEDLGDLATALLNAWLSSVGRETFTTAETRDCTFAHTDGWLVAAEGFVSLVDDPGSFLVVTVDGDVACEFGEILLVSATYRYRWSASEGRWVYHYGSNWSGSVGIGGRLAGEVDFACVQIFEPGDVAGVSAATPQTQVNVDPAVVGLTGLDHWLWYDFTSPDSYLIGPLTASVHSRGFTWTIETTAWVDQVMWDTSCVAECSYRGMADGFDPSGYEYVLDPPDSALAPAETYDGGAGADGAAAFEHVYTRLGETTISAAAVWRGVYQEEGNVPGGGSSVPVVYAPVVVANESTMPIVSIRPELRNAP